jgi:hypothetical protein
MNATFERCLVRSKCRFKTLRAASELSPNFGDGRAGQAAAVMG